MTSLGYGMTAIGSVILWPGPATSFPSGHLLCDGQAVRSIDYPLLHGVISTTYGVGDGSPGYDFNVPDLRGVSPMGVGGTAGLSLSETAGAMTSAHKHGTTALTVEAHGHDPGTYTTAAHTHDLEGTAVMGAGILVGGQISEEAPAVTGTSAMASPGVTGQTDSADGSVLHPVMALHYLICASI